MSVYVKNIKREKSEEIVYNFSVLEDESYILNGVVSHNCRCTMSPVSDDMPKEEGVPTQDIMDWIYN